MQKRQTCFWFSGSACVFFALGASKLTLCQDQTSNVSFVRGYSHHFCHLKYQTINRLIKKINNPC